MRTLQGIIITFFSFTAVWMTAYFLVVRPEHMHWGATPDEIRLGLPGDYAIPAKSETSTRAVTIHARPSHVWRWLVQLGQGRAGLYTYTWLENLFAANIHNADRILPEFQSLSRGDRISLQDHGPTMIATLVYPEQALCFGGWTFALIPLGDHATRLVVRYPSTAAAKGSVHAWLYFAAFEPAHFVMESGQMLGLKARAEGRISP